MSKSELSPAAKAALAAELPVIEAAVARVLPHLMTEIHECPSCGLKVATNFTDVRAAEVLTGVLKKVRNTAGLKF
jgi:hypothetical protein